MKTYKIFSLQIILIFQNTREKYSIPAIFLLARKRANNIIFYSIPFLQKCPKFLKHVVFDFITEFVIPENSIAKIT